VTDSCAIDATLVVELIATQFPEWAHLPIRPVLPGGWDNRTFRLGDDMSVRLPSAHAYAGQVEKEQLWLPRLAPHIPIPIPTPLALGRPSAGYPWAWSIYRWLDGENAAASGVSDTDRFAVELAEFLVALHHIDVSGAPEPGPHNFFRGGPLTTYDQQTRDALAHLAGTIDGHAARALWQAALDATWQKPPVWLHGDISASNLLVRDDRLGAVIDFGCAAVGDPACDLAITWTFFSGASRETFREAVGLDTATWARARGWALWKALITLAGFTSAQADAIALSRRVIDALLAEHRSTV